MARQTLNTEQQVKVYDFIKSFIETKRYSPSLKEIADGTGMCAANAALTVVKKLVEKGYITRTPGQRTISIVEEENAD